MPQKTFLLGLGTTGAEIVSGVIDRAIERFDSLDQCSWIQCLALDTALIPTTNSSEQGLSVADTGNALRIGLPARDFRTFKDTPGELDSIDFNQWKDEAVFLANGASDAGAGNIRMIGRASLLYPDVFTKVHAQVEQRLRRLRAVDLQHATREAGLHVDEAVSNNSYWIYVCGSLTGGTCSGSFIDIGYYLQALCGTQESFSVFGIFGMPHPDAGSARHRANAFTALEELNHYLSDGARYTQRFPLPALFPEPLKRTAEPPYKSSTLLIPRAADKVAMEQTYSAAAEFLATAACSSLTDAVYAKIVDPASSLFNVKSKQRHMNFQSMGSAVLQFPANHIFLGSANKLAADALTEWLAKPGLDAAAASVLLNQERLAFRRLSQDFLRQSMSEESIKDQILKRLSRAQIQLAENNLGYSTTVWNQIQEGFQASTAVPDGIGPNVVSQTIAKNAPIILAERISALQKQIDRRLNSIDDGPNWCRGFAQGILNRCNEMIEEGADPQTHGRSSVLLQTVKEKEEKLEECNSTLNVITGYRKTALQKYSEEWFHAASAYWDSRLEEASGIEVRDVITAMQKFATMVLDRIDGHERSLVPVAKEIAAQASHEYIRLSGVKPVVNGHVVFEPNHTVPTEHARAMAKIEKTDSEGISPARKGEAYAHAWIIREWSLLMQRNSTHALSALTMPDRSPFDRTSGSSEGLSINSTKVQRLAFLWPTRDQFYGDLFTRDVLKELYGPEENVRAEAATVVTGLVGDADAFIDVNDFSSPLGPVRPNDIRQPSFAFFYQARNAGFPYSTFAKAVSTVVDHDRLVPQDDPTRALILRVRTTFPADEIRAVRGYRPFVDQVKANREATLHSRTDIAWRPMDGGPLHPKIQKGIGMFLVGLALGVVERTNPQYILQPPGTTPLRLPPEIELAGLRLCENLNHLAFIEETLRDWVKPAQRSELVQRINSMKLHHATYFPDLTFQYRVLPTLDGGSPGVWVENRLLEQIRPYMAVINEYWQQFGSPYEPKPMQYSHQAGEVRSHLNGQSRPAGYYCHNNECLAYFGDQESDVMEICPDCGLQLLKPGYWERHRAREGTNPAPTRVAAANPFAAKAPSAQPAVPLPMPDEPFQI